MLRGILTERVDRWGVYFTYWNPAMVLEDIELGQRVTNAIGLDPRQGAEYGR